MNIQFPNFLRPLFGNVTWRKSEKEKIVYITFDDGPIPRVTSEILDVLDRFGVKATFFCVGENVQRHPELYDMLLSRGHVTGNHTFNHIKGFSSNLETYIDNVMMAQEWIESKLFRPPHGQITRQQKNALQKKFQIIMWDLITHDYNSSISPATIMKTIKSKTRNGSIVVFHDSLKAERNVLEVLPRALDFWKKEGYQFGVL